MYEGDFITWCCAPPHPDILCYYIEAHGGEKTAFLEQELVGTYAPPVAVHSIAKDAMRHEQFALPNLSFDL
jgi:hypothetical protein